MRAAIGETERRRALQAAYNEEHGITPDVHRQGDRRRDVERLRARLLRHARVRTSGAAFRTQAELEAEIARLEIEMKSAAANLDFERAARAFATTGFEDLRSASLGLASRRRRRADRVLRLSQRWLKAAVLEVQEYVLLCRWRRSAAWSRRPFYCRDIIEQFEQIGVGSLTVVLLTGFFTGAVLALQTGMTLDQFGARPFVGRLVSASMIKELGPVLTGLMLAGRVGSGIAAELGSMVVTDQINALRALGHRPGPQAGRAARAGRDVHGARADRDRRHASGLWADG